ncbi:ribonuclease R [Roseivirga sp. BDSF3-8]|uniref:ribonuclease R n=1 Tax=Roseivirga sp. BDSF3-8 TaxID=3241598 RepID=UPI0035319695
MSKKKKNNKGGQKQSFGQIRTSIQQLLDANTGAAFSLKQIFRKLQYRDKRSKDAAQSALEQLESAGKVQRVGRGGWRTSREPELVVGTVDYVNSRFAYIMVEGLEEDIYVKTEDMLFAFDGDIVKVQVFPQKKGRHDEGRVVEIVERKKDEFVGKIELSPRYAFVVPDSRKVHHDIFVSASKTMKAKHDDKVLVKITQWPEKGKNPEGEVTRILGKSGDNEAEIHSIMAEFDLPFEFPKNVLTQSKRIKTGITKEEIGNRRDFRKITTFTVDPEDAKDFDDALSIQKLKNGNYEIGVHIADVTHYVRPDTVLDNEAYERATSVYLVDRTIPMLPERLSNELCSLRPNEDKLTFSAVFELDGEGHIKKEWFGRTVIHSDRRFSYEEAQERIESLEGDYAKELTIMNELALKLRVERFRRGAIAFETTEVKFVLDENGKPLKVVPKVRKDAHKMIEDFMLLANKCVAEFIFKKKDGKKKLPFVYRVHNFPDTEKLNTFSVFARKFGYKMTLDEAGIAKSLNQLIGEVEGKPEQNVLQQLAIRTMAKAKYSTAEEGHFGLAFPHYTHFTSPIRRYPDMMVHRLLQHYLDNGGPVNKDKYEDRCEHSSDREKRAADAERASVKYKQVEFMEMAGDHPYEGIVSGVTEWGVYVEITETKCEGMIRISDLRDDYYEYDEANFRIIGKNNKKIIALGDDVVVRVTGTDINRRTIDLELIEQ